MVFVLKCSMARHSLAGVEGEVGVDLAHARNNSWSAATGKARPADTMVGRHAGVCAGRSWLCFSERLGLALSLSGVGGGEMRQASKRRRRGLDRLHAAAALCAGERHPGRKGTERLAAGAHTERTKKKTW